uniref:Uncharacterized protein n=1 Tax=Anguilla anguilla TaxID=7936 RepID=A0A0E9XQ13_ANGAN
MIKSIRTTLCFSLILFFQSFMKIDEAHGTFSFH